MSATTLAAPAGLLLLATVPVILWLHLRHRPGRRVLVPSIVPWLFLAAATAGRRWRPPPSWLLAVQLLVALCLALAVARPVVPGRALGALNLVVVLDVSTSMLSDDVWAEARARAADLLASARGEVSLVTLGPRPRVLAAREQGAGAALAALAAVQPGGVGASTDEALALAAAVAGPGAELVVVTDGRVVPPTGTVSGVRWEVLGHVADNVAIVDAAPDPAGFAPRLFARVANLGRSPAQVPLRLLADGQLVHRALLDLAAGETHEAVWDVPPSTHVAEVLLDHVDALAADNHASVPLQTPPWVIQLAGRSPAVERALAALPNTVVEAVGAATYRTDGTVDVSVFVGAGPEALPPGGVILVNPEPGGTLASRGDGHSVALDTLGDAPLLGGLDLSGVTLFNVPTADLPPWAEPLLAVDGRPVVVAGHWRQSSLLALLFDPDVGDVAGRLAFPVLMARAVAAVAPLRPEASLPAGAALGPARPGWRTLVLPDGARRATSAVVDGTGLPGVYRLEGVSGAPGLAVSVLAGDLLESDLGSPVLPATPAPAPGAAGMRDLWPWLVALALGLTVAEAALRWLRATPRRTEAGAR